MTNKPCQIRLTPDDKTMIEGIKKRLGLPSTSSVVRYSVARLYRAMIIEEARADADEARHNYNRGLGLP